MTSTERAAISKAWKREREAALLRGETALLSGRILISEDGKATLLTWNPETREFDRAPLQTENLSSQMKWKLYDYQDKLEAEGGSIVAIDLVLIKFGTGAGALLQYRDDEWHVVSANELLNG